MAKPGSWALCLLLLPLLPSLAMASDVAPLAARVDALNERHPRPADLAFARDMRREYLAGLGRRDAPAHLRSENDSDLAAHWRAVETAAFYSSDRDLADAASRVFQELEHRGLADDGAKARMFDFLLKARRFDDARRFAGTHPGAGLPNVPTFIDMGATAPSVWRFGADGRTAERIGIDLQPLQVIVVAGCHFSEDAARDIARDPVLGPVFARHARWLALPPGNEKLDALADWNRAHPHTPLLPIHDRSEWALIRNWRMPTFAVVADGRVIDSTQGWKSGDPAFREQLMALLRRNLLFDAGADGQR